MLLLLWISATAHAELVPTRDYTIKAGYLPKFIGFVDWPESRWSDGVAYLNIGIIGKNPFGSLLERLESKRIFNKSVAVKTFKGLRELYPNGLPDTSVTHPEIEALRQCHILFICHSERKWLPQTIGLVQDAPVLTVGDVRTFLDVGGIIKFIPENEQVRFEINMRAAEQARLKISSKLLRLARKVIRD